MLPIIPHYRNCEAPPVPPSDTFGDDHGATGHGTCVADIAGGEYMEHKAGHNYAC